MRKHTWAGRALRAVVVGILVLPLLGYFAPTASAHHPILSVDAGCTVESGEWTVTWTVANGDWSGRTMTVDQVDYPDGQLSNIAVGLTLGPNAFTSDTVHYPLSDTGVKTLTVRGDWSSGGPQNVVNSLSLDLGTLDSSRCVPPPGSITVVKVTEGGMGTFSFTSGTLSPSSFDLTTTGTGVAGEDSKTFSELAAGTYDVAEGALGANWALTSATCSDKSDPSEIDLDAGESVTCTFTNTYTPPPQPGTIIIRKITEGSIGTFGFNLVEHSEGNLDNTFNLTTTSQGVAVEKVFEGMSTQSWYSVSEDLPLPTRWGLTSTSCVSSIEGRQPVPEEFALTDGESVTCTFTNTYTPPRTTTTTTTPPPAPGTITIVKITEGGAGTFSFSGTLGSFELTTTQADTPVSKVFAGLDPGIYGVAEGALAEGWSLTSATCSDGSSLDGIVLSEGENVTCTFTNTFTRVAGEVVENTTAPPETLPFTGGSSAGTGGVGIGLLLLGGLILLASRKEAVDG